MKKSGEKVIEYADYVIERKPVLLNLSDIVMASGLLIGHLVQRMFLMRLVKNESGDIQEIMNLVLFLSLQCSCCFPSIGRIKRFV